MALSTLYRNFKALYTFFFSLFVFGGTEVPIVYIFLCRPSEDSLQQSAIPDGSPSQDSSPL
jgi:hypothetical protein